MNKIYIKPKAGFPYQGTDVPFERSVEDMSEDHELLTIRMGIKYILRSDNTKAKIVLITMSVVIIVTSILTLYQSFVYSIEYLLLFTVAIVMEMFIMNELIKLAFGVHEIQTGEGLF